LQKVKGKLNDRPAREYSIHLVDLQGAELLEIEDNPGDTAVEMLLSTKELNSMVTEFSSIASKVMAISVACTSDDKSLGDDEVDMEPPSNSRGNYLRFNTVRFSSASELLSTARIFSVCWFCYC